MPCPYHERGLACRNAGPDGVCRCRTGPTQPSRTVLLGVHRMLTSALCAPRLVRSRLAEACEVLGNELTEPHRTSATQLATRAEVAAYCAAHPEEVDELAEHGPEERAAYVWQKLHPGPPGIAEACGHLDDALRHLRELEESEPQANALYSVRAALAALYGEPPPPDDADNPPSDAKP